MHRYQTIDAFRGLAILGMVFFTTTLRLSKNLPETLKHNVWGSIHLGDFVLPMFLFASGLSLAFYLEKYEKKILPKKVFRRFIILVLIAISLSIFSAYGFLEMDEVMLSALLFIACIALSKLDWKIILGVVFLINLSYIALIQLNYENIFVGHYLGGYPAALYYLPVMLTGFLVGKEIISNRLWSNKNKLTILLIFIFFVLFWFLIPLNKMTATPSFIMLSILFSFLVFILVEKIISLNISFKRLKNLGKKPLRYWLIMYIVFLIPLWFYIEFYDLSFPLNLQWHIAILISLGFMILFYTVSCLIEYIDISN